MTALKPIENLRVRGVASERYPLNKKCAHPECREDAVDPHHAFPRSAIGNDSWFVEIESEGPDFQVGFVVLPHVTGLCRAHHDAVEEHRAWIKLEDTTYGGQQFVWYDRTGEPPASEDYRPLDTIDATWTPLGPLNPQPGSVEGKSKRKKFRGEKRRKRVTISIKVPKDEQEDGAGLLDDAVELLEGRLKGDDDPRPVYYTIMDALNFTILNADADDFS